MFPRATRGGRVGPWTRAPHRPLPPFDARALVVRSRRLRGPGPCGIDSGDPTRMLLGAVLGLRTGFTRPSSRWEGEESGRGLARFARAGHGSSDLGWERRAVSQKRQKQEPVTETLMPPNPQSHPDSLFNVPVLSPPRSDVRSCAPRGERSNPWSRRRRFQALVLVPALLGRWRRHEEEAGHPLPRCKIQSETVPSI